MKKDFWQGLIEWIRQVYLGSANTAIRTRIFRAQFQYQEKRKNRLENNILNKNDVTN